MAGFFARREATLQYFSQGVVFPFLYLSAVAVLLLLQPDFGSTVILTLVMLGMGVVAGVRLRHMALSMSGALVCVVLLVLFSPYRLSRVLSFLNPLSDVSGKGYQLIQSLIAVGTGQFSGVGLGDGQQKLFFLPAAHTDFIFAVIAEELGFIGALIVIFAFVFFLRRGFMLAGKVANDAFRSTLAVGLTLLIVLPAFLNMGVVVGLLPTKGLVLPLLAYGGSSLVASLATVGLLLALARECQQNQG